MKSKEQKRQEAEERQIFYNELTWQQRLARLNRGNFVAFKERGKNGFPSLGEVPDNTTKGDF